MTILFDSVPGLFDAAAGLFDDSAVQSGTAIVTGLQATTSIGVVTSNGVRNGIATISGVVGTTSLGVVSAVSDTQPVKSGGRRRKPGVFIPYQGGSYTAPPEVKHAAAICLSQEAASSVGRVTASATVHIAGRATLKSIKVQTGFDYVEAHGVINPTEEEWQLLLAA